MVSKKPKIVIIGAGMAGLVAAHNLYRASTLSSDHLFDLCVVEGGDRIGGRINTSELNGNLIELGATWIHGIVGSPVHQIAQQIGALHSDKPWERMDGFPEDSVTAFEDGSVADPSIVDPISNLYRNLMEFAKGKKKKKNRIPPILKGMSIGEFLRRGLDEYCAQRLHHLCNLLSSDGEEAVFAMNENIERTYTGAGDLFNLDFNSEHEYQEFPGEEITIAKGYSSIIEYLASAIPLGMIHLSKKVVKVEWCVEEISVNYDGFSTPVKLHFEDGSVMEADHVIVTVSLGVLKSGIKDQHGNGMFSPPLPSFKTQAISRLGFGVVNKLFLQLNQNQNQNQVFPSLQMAFHQDNSCRDESIPWWIRRTASLLPIYNNSNVVLAWFAGKEAVELEALQDEEIIDGVSMTISKFLPNSDGIHKCSNGEISGVVRSRWASDPLFMGSYSYVAVGSSGDDIDSMAKPLPISTKDGSTPPPLQILFAGEATHRTHYSTTHGAYYSGVREANRLLQHYKCAVSSELLLH
ncbi:hypothetical protein Scep_007796 [Stephania cephalantha]|uniref:Amine oxidase domain-containing protein n=1 Tax=Stephania cephalantha TaxID=152367 RepID=A0AAP0KC97_9MAGN